MARLAQEWAEKTFILKEISSIERDMCNGYNFIEIGKQAGLVNDDDYELAKDTQDPAEILKNFAVLTKSLKDINIRVTKKMVAEIMSEQPGSAAALIMNIKRGLELKNKPVSNVPEYRHSLKSLMPNPNFKRQHHKYAELNSETKVIADIYDTVDFSNFNALSLRCQFRQYERFKYESEVKVREFEKIQEVIAKEKIVERRIADIEKLRSVRLAREEKERILKQNWKETQKVKKERQIRDLHFENAVYAVREFKRVRDSQNHFSEQCRGIDEFEQILRRAGITGGDDEIPLACSYEEGEAFIKRLEEAVVKKWPTNESINDFMLLLKETTKSNRLARHEKAVRKRKMLVEQQVAALESTRKAEIAVAEELRSTFKAKQEKDLQDAEDKANAKREAMIQSEAKCLEMRKKMEDDAELFLQIFSEQQRMIADERDSAAELEKIANAQEERRVKKIANRYALCKSILMEVVSSLPVFDDPEARARQVFLLKNIDEDMKFAETIVDMCEVSCSKYEEERSFYATPVLDVMPEYMWSMYCGLIKNVASWRAVSVNKLANQQVPVEAENENNDEFRPINPGDNAIVVNKRELSYSETCSDALQQLLFAIAAKASGKESSKSVLESGYVPALQHACVSYSKTKTFIKNDIVLLCGDSTFESNVCFNSSGGVIYKRELWNAIEQCASGLSDVAFIDISLAVEWGKKLHSLIVEAKQPLTIAILSEVFSGGQLKPSEELQNAKILPAAQAICSEITDLCVKIFSIQPAVQNSGPGDMAINAFPFSKISLCILLANILWLRRYFIDMWNTLEQSVCTLPTSVVTGKLFTKAAIFNTAIHVKIFQLYLEGSSRDASEPDADITAALQSEGIQLKFPGTKDASKKGAAPEESPIPPVKLTIGGVVWLRSLEMNAVVAIPIPVDDKKGKDKALKTKESEANLTMKDYVQLVLEKHGRACDIDSKAKDSGTAIGFPMTFSVSWKNPVSVFCLELLDTAEVAVEQKAFQFSSVSYRNPLSIILNITSAVVCSWSNMEIPSQELQDLSAQWTANVRTKLIEVNKAILGLLEDPVIKLYIEHFSGTFRYTGSSLINCLKNLSASSTMQVEWFSLLWASVSAGASHCDFFKRSVHHDFVNKIKCPEAAFHVVYNNFKGKIREKLPSKLGDTLLASTLNEKSVIAGTQGKTSSKFSMTFSGKITADTSVVVDTLEQVNLVKVAVAELTCALGNIIDKSHREYLTYADTLQEKITSEFKLYVLHVFKLLLPLFARCAAGILLEKQFAMESLVKHWMECGYFSADSDGKLPIRLVYLANFTSVSAQKFQVERKSDEVRSTLADLNNILRNVLAEDSQNLVLDSAEFDSSLNVQMNLWQSVLGFSYGNSEACGVFSDNFAVIQRELHYELLNQVDCLLKAMFSTVKRMFEVQLPMSKSDFSDMILRRVKYQHEILHKWSMDVTRAFHLNQPANQLQSASMSAKGKRKLSTATAYTRSRQAEEPLDEWYNGGLEFLNRFHFDVSSNVMDDDVPWISDCPLIDVRDFALSAESIVKLSHQMSLSLNKFLMGELNLATGRPHSSEERPRTDSEDLILQQAMVGYVQAKSPETVQNRGIDDDSLLVQSLLSCIQSLVNDQETLPPSWTDIRRLEQLVRAFKPNVSPKENEYSDGELTKSEFRSRLNLIRLFFQKIVISLVFALCPIAPTVNYIVKLSAFLLREATLDGNRSENREDKVQQEGEVQEPVEQDDDLYVSVPLARFRAKLADHVELSMGWWCIDNPNDSGLRSLIVNLLSAIGHVCCDVRQGIIIEEFVKTMCMLPSSVPANTTTDYDVLLTVPGDLYEEKRCKGNELFGIFNNPAFYKLSAVVNGIVPFKAAFGVSASTDLIDLTGELGGVESFKIWPQPSDARNAGISLTLTQFQWIFEKLCRDRFETKVECEEASKELFDKVFPKSGGVHFMRNNEIIESPEPIAPAAPTDPVASIEVDDAVSVGNSVVTELKSLASENTLLSRESTMYMLKTLSEGRAALSQLPYCLSTQDLLSSVMKCNGLNLPNSM